MGCLTAARSIRRRHPQLTVVRPVGSDQVAAADPPHRLSYTLGECQSDPTVYVTWELRSGDGLTIVRLYIDEPDAYPGSEDDLHIIWLPILSALTENLSNPPATGQAA